jgi:hypothetical protein
VCSTESGQRSSASLSPNICGPAAVVDHRARGVGYATGSPGVAWLRRNSRSRNCALAIRDYYHFWKSRNEFPRAGKLLLDNPEDSRIIQMFFDDNIGYTSAHIVDVRDVRTGESVPFSKVKNAQLNRAEPVNAILDDMFFVRCGWGVSGASFWEGLSLFFPRGSFPPIKTVCWV